ncbi:MAG TPA: hypothetical protein VGZ02_03820 [Candidatus Baltobacteraceae bacterium]|jgi:hypothetical protein|nr:hypothetical protein [Candidatus Baltobacteraceae bacterium]
MYSLHLKTIRAAGIAAAVALLASCNGHSAGALPVANTANAALFSSVTKTLFVADPLADRVRIFAAGIQHGAQIGAITSGVSAPQGLFVDSNGVLYVANTQSVTEYQPGAFSPFRTLKNVSNAVSLTVDRQGTVYVGQGCQIVPSGGSIAVFSSGSTTPSRTIALNECSFMGGITTDLAGNLIVSFFQYPAKIQHVLEFARGASSGRELGIQGIAEIGATLRTDRSGNLYATSGTGVNVYAPGASLPARSITAGMESPTGIALDGSGNLYVANYPGPIGASFINVYARGGKVPINSFMGGLTTLEGVAVRPAQ